MKAIIYRAATSHMNRLTDIIYSFGVTTFCGIFRSLRDSEKVMSVAFYVCSKIFFIHRNTINRNNVITKHDFL